MALSETPDVVLLDLGLPGIDGYEVARRIREKTDKPLLMAMTGYGQAEDRERSKEAGFEYHFQPGGNPLAAGSMVQPKGSNGGTTHSPRPFYPLAISTPAALR